MPFDVCRDVLYSESGRVSLGRLGVVLGGQQRRCFGRQRIGWAEVEVSWTTVCARSWGLGCGAEGATGVRR